MSSARPTAQIVLTPPVHGQQHYTHSLQPAYQIYVSTDQCEIKPMAVADVAVAGLAMVQRDAGAKLGVGYGDSP